METKLKCQRGKENMPGSKGRGDDEKRPRVSSNPVVLTREVDYMFPVGTVA